MTKEGRKLYLIDGSNYIFRAYYAIGPLSNSKGLPTNAIYGFTRMLLKLLREEKPDYVVVAFDSMEKTFRDEMYPEYKANRKEPPDDLIPQFPFFPKVVEALNIPILIVPGYEADDIIGTIVSKVKGEGLEKVIVTGDKDFMQLVSEDVTILDTMKERKIGVKEVGDIFGVGPDKVIDVLGLSGDSSDNIPGVPGIGLKTAKKLVREYGTIEDMMKSLKKISHPGVQTKLTEHEKEAALSKELVTIKRDVPMKFKLEDFIVSAPRQDQLKDLFEELEFSRLLSDFKLQPKVKGMKHDLISDERGLQELMQEIKESGEFAIEAFVLGKPFLGGEVVGLGVSPKEGRAFYIPLRHGGLNLSGHLEEREAFEALKPLFKDTKIIKIGHDFKSTLNILINYGIKNCGDVIDTELLSYVLNPTLNHDLKEVAHRELKMDVGDVKIEKLKDMASDAVEAASARADAVTRLSKIFSSQLRDEGLKKVYSEIEIPLIYILSSMEQKGVRVDKKVLERLDGIYSRKLSELSRDIYSEAGEEFSIQSPKQLSKILFERLKLPVIKKTKTGYSTDIDVLSELAKDYKLPQLILDFRSLSKLKSTYIDAFPALISPKTGRIHTTFNQAVTATGRLSSSDPNLQNIPARSDEGKRIREAFIADDGFLLLSSDYSQIELRVLAHLTGEEVLIEAFKEGKDIHTMTAASIFNVSPKKVTEKERLIGKTVNFSVLYGQTPFGLSRRLQIEVEAAKKYIDDYYKKYLKVARYKEKVLEEARKKGYVETLFGRRRYFPDIESKNATVKALNERMAFNTVFQGTAADIIKLAMIKIHKELPNISHKSSMILQVHDELLFEVPLSDTEVVKDYVIGAMSNITRLSVPLSVDVGVGKNWAEC